MYKVKFADIGEGLTEGKVAEVLVKIGAEVKAGDSLFFVETDKVNSEIPAPTSGKVTKINIQKDQEIKVGDVVMEIDDGTVSDVTTKTQTQPIEENASVVGATPVSDEVITRKTPTTSNPNMMTIRATPIARKMASELKIDLSTITPSGPGGRILVQDLKVQNQDSSKIVSSSSKPNLQKDAQFLFETKPMNGVRKATVKAMTYSHQTNAAFTGIRTIDVTSTVELRSNLKKLAEEQKIKLTYLAFIVKAAVKVLQEMPNINVQIDEANKTIKYIKNINIGIAVDTPDGLMVPVIKNVDQLSVLEIASAIAELADKAKTKKLTLKEMSEGTFTISNFGSVGLEYATPIINSPESAILGVGTMVKTPVYFGEEIQPRFMMPFSMTADHRVIDGADTGRFLLKLESYLQNPIKLFV